LAPAKKHKACASSGSATRPALNRTRAHGIATVIVDKNYRAVTAIADRNVILVKGRVVFEGDSKALLAQPDVLQRHLGV
jgi:branched-chain amino acid transport system ATP-binding protein